MAFKRTKFYIALAFITPISFSIAQAEEVIGKGLQQGVSPAQNDFNTVSTLPSFSLIAPTGFTPTQDYIAASLGGITNAPGTASASLAAASIGLGLSLPADFGVTLNIDMDAPDLARRQELSMSVGKYFTSLDMGVSFGVRNMTLWHNDGSTNVPTAYMTASKMMVFGSQLAILNAGLGNNDLRNISDTSPSKTRVKRVSPFASAAYYPLPQLSIIADYTAGISTLGVGYVPFNSLPISLNLGVYDVTSAIPAHANISFIGSLTISTTY